MAPPSHSCAPSTAGHGLRLPRCVGPCVLPSPARWCWAALTLPLFKSTGVSSGKGPDSAGTTAERTWLTGQTQLQGRLLWPCGPPSSRSGRPIICCAPPGRPRGPTRPAVSWELENKSREKRAGRGPKRWEAGSAGPSTAAAATAACARAHLEPCPPDRAQGSAGSPGSDWVLRARSGWGAGRA